MRRTLIIVLLVTLLAPLAMTAESADYAAGQTVVATSAGWLRQAPATSAETIRRVEVGDLLELDDIAPVYAEGLTWRHVRTSTGGTIGWLPDNYFEAALQNAPGSPACWTSNAATVEEMFSWAAPPDMTIDPESTYIATITTSEGTIMLKLDAEHAPIAANNFVCLAEAGYYDGVIFHRIASDFLIQAGDRSGTGTGNAGYTVPSDPTTGEYPEGAIALANSTPDENGSQFFITAADLTGQIPDDYPVFGHVVAGQAVVSFISRGAVDFNPRGELSQPIDPVTILSVEITRQNDEVGPPLPTMPPAVDAPPVPTVAVAPTVAMPPTTTTAILLDAKDIAFDPDEITIDAANLPVTIKMENTGAALHNFAIDALDIDVDVQPGETVDVVIPAGTAPGTYDFYCSVPGHKEAGMVGTLIVQEGSSASGSIPTATSVGSTAGCEGFSQYQRQYEDALYAAFIANPEATEILANWDSSDAEMEDLSSSQLVSLSEFFSYAARELDRISPPQIAAEWHELKVEQTHTFARFLDDASTVGVFVAGISYSPEVDRLDAAIARALTHASACPQFVTWAEEY